MDLTTHADSTRDRCFRFYSKASRQIAPGLEYAQSIYERVLSDAVRTRERWLDVGCGHQVLPAWRASEEVRLTRSVRRAVGVDYDHLSLRQHATIRHRVRADIETLPFRDGSFDLVTANMVLEHVAKPHRLVTEICRILEPGGLFLAHTPNVSGYITVMARMVPESVRPRLAGWLHNRPEADVFPTHYRINSETALRRTGTEAGFSRVTVRYLVSDAQLVMLPPLAVLELFAIRMLMTRPLRLLRPYLIAMMEKPGGDVRRAAATTAAVPGRA